MGTELTDGLLSKFCCRRHDELLHDTIANIQVKLGKDKHHDDIVSYDVGIYHINLLNRLLVGYCPGIAFVIRHRLLGDQFTQVNPGN